MPLKAEEKASIGRWYVDTMEKRIKLREEHQQKLIKQSKFDIMEHPSVVKTIARVIKALHPGKAVVAKQHADTHYFDHAGRNEGVEVRLDNGIGFFFTFPQEAIDAKQEHARVASLAGEVCSEIEFLRKWLYPTSFQDYVAKLYAVEPSVSQCKDALESFLNAKRPAVCKAA